MRRVFDTVNGNRDSRTHCTEPREKERYCKKVRRPSERWK